MARRTPYARAVAPLEVLGDGALLGGGRGAVVSDHARRLPPLASIVSVVLAPLVVSSEARPTRPECPVIMP